MVIFIKNWWINGQIVHNMVYATLHFSLVSQLIYIFFYFLNFQGKVQKIKWSYLLLICIYALTCMKRQCIFTILLKYISSCLQAFCRPEASFWSCINRTPAAGLSQQAWADCADISIRVSLHWAAGHLRCTQLQGQSVDLWQSQLCSHTGHPQGEKALPRAQKKKI